MKNYIFLWSILLLVTACSGDSSDGGGTTPVPPPTTDVKVAIVTEIETRAVAKKVYASGDQMNVWAKTYAEVNVESLNRFEDGTVVDPVALVESGILKNVRDGIRILGKGELTKKLTVRANGFTKSAEEKITAAGGQIEKIEVK
jgi:ribosomal protein L15